MQTKIQLIVILLLFPCFLIGQNGFPDSIVLKRIEESVTKNIFIYRIRNSQYINNMFNGQFIILHNHFDKSHPDKIPYKIYTDTSHYTTDSYNTFPDNVFPYCGCKFELDIEKLEIEYPDTSITLYSIIKQREEYICDTADIYPYYNPYYIYDHYFLVGVSPKGFVEYFISGTFYLHSIKDDFPLDIEIPESFYNYIKLKTFSWQTEEIIFLEKRENELVFRAYSNILLKIIYVIIKKDDLDTVYVKDNIQWECTK